MNQFNFKSQVCTDRFQSERLLALSLKKETADCYLVVEKEEVTIVAKPYYKIIKELDGLSFDAEIIPAWSLHRLLCLYGADYEIKEVYNNAEECYGMLICAIEIAIENGDFNEEYLER